MQIVPPDLNIDFLSRRRLWIGVSWAVIALGIVATFLRGGVPIGIDFAGGTEFQLRFDEGVVVDESSLRDVVRGEGFADATVVRFGEADSREFLVKFRERPDERTDGTADAAGTPAGDAGSEGGSEAGAAAGTAADAAAVPAGEIADGFEVNTRMALLQKAIRAQIGGFVEQRVEYVGPKVGADLRRDGLKAMLYSAIAILIYVGFRFNSRYPPRAIVATFHGVFVTAAFLVMADVEFDLQILAAMLAIVGYSLNDTIVIYDRARENLVLHPGVDLEKVLNMSVNQTMSRTILTGGTTMMTLSALIFLGGEVIFPFSITMLIGIVVGTYSSIFIASPVLLFLDERYGGVRNKPKGASSTRPTARVKGARA